MTRFDIVICFFLGGVGGIFRVQICIGRCLGGQLCLRAWHVRGIGGLTLYISGRVFVYIGSCVLDDGDMVVRYLLSGIEGCG